MLRFFNVSLNILAVLFFSCSCYFFYREYLFLDKSVSVVGKVLEIKKAEFQNISVPTEEDIGTPHAGAARKYTNYIAMLEYKDSVTQLMKQVTIPVDANYDIGYPINLLISQDDENSVKSNTLWSKWGRSLILLIATILCGGLAIACATPSRNKVNLLLANVVNY